MEYLPTDLPKYVKTANRSQFSDAVVQDGHILLFSQDGKTLTAKNSDGSFTALGGQNAEAGYVKRTNDRLYFYGASDNPQLQPTESRIVSNLYTVDTPYGPPEYPSSGGRNVVAGYIKKDNNLIKFFPVGSTQGIQVSSLRMSDTGQASPDYKGSGSSSFYKCSSVTDLTLTSPASWSGYKAILSSGKYSFSTVETTGLTYTSIKPVVGGIYTQDALVIIKDIYSGFPVDGLIFYAPLKTEKANAETSQQLTYNGTYAFSDTGGLSCIDLSNGYVTIQGTSGLSLNSFSIVMWVNMKSTSGWQNLFGTGIDNNLNIAVKDGIPVFWGGSYTIGGTDILQLNKWYCICGSYTDSAISTYINGVQNFTGSYTKSMSISSNLKIGKSSDNCNARIAAVRLYNRVLSASQVAALTSEYTPTAE